MKTTVDSDYGRIVWTDGEIAGDALAVKAVSADFTDPPYAYGGQPWGSIDNPDLKLHLDFVVAALDRLPGAKLSGDFPPIEQLPSGAVG